MPVPSNIFTGNTAEISRALQTDKQRGTWRIMLFQYSSIRYNLY